MDSVLESKSMPEELRFAAMDKDDRECLNCGADYTAHLEGLRCPSGTVKARRETEYEIQWHSNPEMPRWEMLTLSKNNIIKYCLFSRMEIEQRGRYVIECEAIEFFKAMEAMKHA